MGHAAQEMMRMAAIDDADWRLHGQEQDLLGAVLRRRRYLPPRPDWDHDHCEFCWVKFMDVDHPGIERDGYVTRDGYRWICHTCFDSFRARFGWTVEVPDSEVPDSGGA